MSRHSSHSQHLLQVPRIQQRELVPSGPFPPPQDPERVSRGGGGGAGAEDHARAPFLRTNPAWVSECVWGGGEEHNQSIRKICERLHPFFLFCDLNSPAQFRPP